MLPKGQKKSWGIVLAAICWAPSAQRRCHQKEALHLPTFSHLLIVNKLLSLSLSLSLSTCTTYGMHAFLQEYVMCHMRRRIHACHVSYEEEDTFMSCVV